MPALRAIGGTPRSMVHVLRSMALEMSWVIVNFVMLAAEISVTCCYCNSVQMIISIREIIGVKLNCFLLYGADLCTN